jgi:DNA-directed RNA polymerase specialized sigma24 family protein
VKKRSSTLTQQDFVRFLRWLDPDPERAGELYNSFHRRLMLYFTGRGCGAAAAELASEALDRTAEKFAAEEGPENREPARYIFQVAKFIHLEHLRSPQPGPLDFETAAAPRRDDESIQLKCCKQCLSQLPEEERDILQDYYLGEKQGEAKRIREAVAGELGVAQGALRIRVFRAKQKVFKCMNQCLQNG